MDITEYLMDILTRFGLYMTVLGPFMLIIWIGLKTTEDDD